MDSQSTFIIGALLGISSGVFGIILNYQILRRGWERTREKIEEAEKDLIRDAERIGVINLEQTLAGREFLLLADSVDQFKSTLRGEEVSMETRIWAIMDLYNLTGSESSVLKMLAKGLEIKEIAEQLDISERVVYRYTASIRNKIGTTRFAELFTGEYSKPS